MTYEAPPLPRGLLPKVIEQFAFAQGKLMGCDPSGLAMGALTVCAAAIPDIIKIQVKQNDRRWKESTRIRTGLEGNVSSQKSPIMRRVIEPLDKIDARLRASYQAALQAYKELSTEERKGAAQPLHTRIKIEDTTPEAAQEILKDSSDGVLLFRDELSGW
jgi:hypothetical protein